MTPEVASDAAEVAAGYESRLIRIEGHLSLLKTFVTFGIILNVVTFGVLLWRT